MDCLVLNFIFFSTGRVVKDFESRSKRKNGQWIYLLECCIDGFLPGVRLVVGQNVEYAEVLSLSLSLSLSFSFLTQSKH